MNFYTLENPTLLKINCMEFLASNLCFLLAKLTFESYKLLIKLSQTSKLVYKKYVGFFGVRKI